MTTNKHPLPARIGWLAVALAAIPLAASAQSTGRLYDPMPPEDSAYVRVVQAGSGAPVVVSVDGKVKVKQLAARTASEYWVLPAGKHVIQLQSGGKAGPRMTLDAAEQGAYTIAFPSAAANARAYAFQDRTGTNKLKAMMAVYHLAPGAGTLDVTTADGKTKVFSGLKAGAPAIIEVNPIQVKLVASRGGVPLANAALNMRQGNAYSIFLFPSGAQGVSAVTLQNQRERYTGK
jgi:Alginate O-acetyl transferase AlgF.